MSELFKDIPEFVETVIGESIAARTETLGGSYIESADYSYIPRIRTSRPVSGHQVHWLKDRSQSCEYGVDVANDSSAPITIGKFYTNQLM